MRVELQAVAGSTHTQAVTLLNDGTEAVRVHTEIFDYYLSKDGTPQFIPLEAGESDRPFSTAPWIRLASPEQTIGPGQLGTVRYTTSVPAATPDGGYRAAIMFQFGPATGDVRSRGTGLTIRSRVASLLYLTVGSPSPRVDLTDMWLHAPDGQTPQIIATLENSGRVHVRSKGTLRIYDTAGTLVREVQVPRVPILAESELDLRIAMTSESQNPLPPGEYRVEVSIDVGLFALLVGETTVEFPPLE